MSDHKYDAAQGKAYLHGSKALADSGQMGLALYYAHAAERHFRSVQDGPSIGAASRQENRVVGDMAGSFAEAAKDGAPGFLAALTASREMGDYRERTDGVAVPFGATLLKEEALVATLFGLGLLELRHQRVGEAERVVRVFAGVPRELGQRHRIHR